VMTIVGVVGNARPLLQVDAVPQIYVPHFQQTDPNATLLVRSAAGKPLPMNAVKAAVRSVLPDQPLFNIRPLADVVSQSVARQRAVAQLLGAFALLALFMSTCGIYTVVTYATSRRAREIALRLAIGAKARNVLALVGTQTFVSAIVGLLLGIFGAVAASNALRAALVGVEALEGITVVLAGVLYLLVVGAAIYVPASRALRIDPAIILRIE
jgi:putative ABC transport system permease protein